MEAVFVLLILLFLAIWYYHSQGQKEKKYLQQCWDHYQNKLKSGNVDDALKAGRLYYSALRKNKLTIYDEQAIANDLATITKNGNSYSVADEITKLKKQLDEGLLTPEEFQKLKGKLIAYTNEKH